MTDAITDAAEYVIALYLLYRWLGSCCTGLMKAVLNDYVSKGNRSKASHERATRARD